jgi:hypothetical protein
MRRVILLVVLLAALTGCAPDSGGDEMQAAQTELVAYFAMLAHGDYELAAGMMADNPDFWDMAQANNPDVDPGDEAALLQAVCERQSLCMPVHDVVDGEEVKEGVYRFTVRFALEGEVFVLGPCCGADESEMPPISEFSYEVIKAGDRFLVEAEPLYVP